MRSVNIWGTGTSDGAGSGDIANLKSRLYSKVDKNGDEMAGDLLMNGYKITGLPTNINLIADNSDAASYGVCSELLINGLLGRVSKDGDDMNGDLLLKIGFDSVRTLGCNDLNDHTGFQLLLGNYQNQIQYERQNAVPQPIKVLTNNGILFQLNGNDLVRIGSSADQRVMLFNDIVMNGNNIASLADPISSQDAATKSYVDNKARKCETGLVPFLTANEDGYIVSASSEFSSSYLAYNAFKLGSEEWATFGITSDFWFKIKCLERVRIWRFSAAGRNFPGHELINWRFEGSNDDVTWTILRAEPNFLIGAALLLFYINTAQYFQYYRLHVVQANGINPGLRHFQLYVHSE